MAPIVDIVQSHHENWDGSGYPQARVGNEVPIGGRIIRAADVYDAVTTRRPYQALMEPEAALAYMKGMAGKALDPEILDALEAAVNLRKTLVFLDQD
jgi:HD-GYP domain-containing protein (c-di-GMP phosphodiesterase class II)